MHVLLLKKINFILIGLIWSINNSWNYYLIITFDEFFQKKLYHFFNIYD